MMGEQPFVEPFGFANTTVLLKNADCFDDGVVWNS